MLTQKSLGMEEAQRVIAGVVQAARDGNRTMAAVVVDNHGDVIASVRMDGAPPRFLGTAHRKAYTAAVMGRNTTGLKQWWKDTDGGHGDWNDRMLTTLSGGLTVLIGSEVVGGIGVGGGNNVTRDPDVAATGLRALGEGFRSREDWT